MFHLNRLVTTNVCLIVIPNKSSLYFMSDIEFTRTVIIDCDVIRYIKVYDCRACESPFIVDRPEKLV